jgi:oligopeptide transport system substrate-binding protein
MAVRTRALAIAALLLLAGCGNSGPEGAKLTVTVVGDASRPDGLTRRLEAEATQPTLIARDGAGQTVAGLATSWRFVDDGRSLILRLRPVKWSDGKALGSNEVVAAYRRAAARREPAIANSGLAGAQAIIDGRAPVSRLGVLAPISRVVEMRLEAASPLLLGWLAEPGLGITRTGKTPATLPATLAAYDADGPMEKRRLKRRSMTAAPDSRPAEIILTTTSDSAAAVTAFTHGDTDIVMGEGLTGLGNARAGARPDALRIDPVWGIYGYVANSMRGPLASPEVRRALAMAVDRASLTQRFGIAAIAPAEGLLPPSTGAGAAHGTPDSDGDADGSVVVVTPQPDAAAALAAPAGPDWLRMDMTARRAEAQRLLAAAGWNSGHPLRLVLLLPPGRDHRSVAELVAADWAEIGVGLAVSEVGTRDIEARLARGAFDLALTEASLPVADGAALLARWRCGGGLHCNAAADAWLDAARLAPPAARDALLAHSEAVMMTGPPMIPLFTPIRWTLVARNVDGWVPNRAASHPLARLSVAGQR